MQEIAYIVWLLSVHMYGISMGENSSHTNFSMHSQHDANETYYKNVCEGRAMPNLGESGYTRDPCCCMGFTGCRAARKQN